MCSRNRNPVGFRLAGVLCAVCVVFLAMAGWADEAESSSAAAAAKPDQALTGEYTLKLKAVKFDGKSAAGVEYSLLSFDPMKGMFPARKGALDERGEAAIPGLPGGEGAPMFILEMMGDYIEQLQFDGPEKIVTVDVTLPCGPGDMAPDIVMIDADSGVPMKLSQLRGQVVFLEFWATWCAPCQEPMKHNNEILKRRAKDWEGKAAIIALSIDEDLESLNKLVARNRWFAVPHKWASRGAKGFKSEQALAFGVSGVPTGLLIGRDGKIVWRGHPATIDVEKKIDEALGGK